MADKIKITLQVVYTPGTTTAVNKPITESPDSLSITMTGTDFIRQVQNVGTSNESLTEGEIGTLGWCLIYNLDATNFVEVGLTSSYTIKILAGHFALFQASSGALFGKADTAAVDILKVFFEV